MIFNSLTSRTKISLYICKLKNLKYFSSNNNNSSLDISFKNKFKNYFNDYCNNIKSLFIKNEKYDAWLLQIEDIWKKYSYYKTLNNNILLEQNKNELLSQIQTLKNSIKDSQLLITLNHYDYVIKQAPTNIYQLKLNTYINNIYINNILVNIYSDLINKQKLDDLNTSKFCSIIVDQKQTSTYLLYENINIDSSCSNLYYLHCFNQNNLIIEDIFEYIYHNKNIIINYNYNYNKCIDYNNKFKNIKYKFSNIYLDKSILNDTAKIEIFVPISTVFTITFIYLCMLWKLTH
jgi:hypothetical protein